MYYIYILMFLCILLNYINDLNAFYKNQKTYESYVNLDLTCWVNLVDNRRDTWGIEREQMPDFTNTPSPNYAPTECALFIVMIIIYIYIYIYHVLYKIGYYFCVPRNGFQWKYFKQLPIVFVPEGYTWINSQLK